MNEEIINWPRMTRAILYMSGLSIVVSATAVAIIRILSYIPS